MRFGDLSRRRASRTWPRMHIAGAERRRSKACRASALRLHLCWGNFAGPHIHDVPLRDILDDRAGGARWRPVVRGRQPAPRPRVEGLRGRRPAGRPGADSRCHRLVHQLRRAPGARGGAPAATSSTSSAQTASSPAPTAASARQSVRATSRPASPGPSCRRWSRARAWPRAKVLPAVSSRRRACAKVFGHGPAGASRSARRAGWSVQAGRSCQTRCGAR